MAGIPAEIEAVVEGGVSGEFLTIAGERYYAIHKVDRMPPFLMSVISNVDHWLFVSSTGGLTAGRVSPDTALFPYITVDRIHESSSHTGSKTVLRIQSSGRARLWEPFNREHDDRYRISRHLYKNVLGNKVRFEEINQDLNLAFRYTWLTSDEFGFVRRCELENIGDTGVRVELFDGLQNVLPAGTPSAAQADASNLVNAYKWTELYEETGLAIYALYSGISDRAEPRESLRANSAFCLGLGDKRVLLSPRQLDAFRNGDPLQQEAHTRGIRGAYFVNAELGLAGGESHQWEVVADIEKTQGQIIDLRRRLGKPGELMEAITHSVECGSEELAQIIAAADGFQQTAEENVTVHHYANVLFNVLRGGIFDDQYSVSAQDLVRTIRHFNRAIFDRNEELLDGLQEKLRLQDLLSVIREGDDPQLERLCYEYLPITFGRRHGDPSRPWNTFSIRLKDAYGNRLLSYEGNWRDIFQNWEALTFSYPEFIENVIAKFVNASTPDGYNPYRITKDGIDWEVEEPDDPWSYIGYWGDHQIIYLLKLLELSRQFHPTRLAELLRRPVFSYANVPYRIKPFEALLENPKDTVVYDSELAERIEDRVARMGADGKLLMDTDRQVYQVNLLEKLLVPLLAKLGNLVIDGGIWLNTQRPEWNDANNALVGHGLSMVTLYYMRRYVHFLQQLLAEESEPTELSSEVTLWLRETALALESVRPLLGDGPLSADHRHQALVELGRAAGRYRQAIYERESFSGRTTEPVGTIKRLLDDALAVIDQSIATNRRSDGLFHAYNLLNRDNAGIEIDTLYPMLEGQVAALSSGTVSPAEALETLEALFASDIYRPDQHSFMLYPDRELPSFLDKNRIPAEDVESIPLLQRMLAEGDNRILVRDSEGCYRFDADFANVGDLRDRLDSLAPVYGDELEAARKPLQSLYEKVFRHRLFTGRSGGMFGFEGLGCIYWHMVSKLLLAVQENFFAAIEQGADNAICDRLGSMYYRVRDGIGFNKTPWEYGAFPTDPYSHTPKHAGARQPGMTGQVKEEVLTRFGELGVRIDSGQVHFDPKLLRRREFASDARPFRYLDISGNWQTLALPASSLAFTWCQVPVVYRLDERAGASLVIRWRDGRVDSLAEPVLSRDASEELFERSGEICQITIHVASEDLFGD